MKSERAGAARPKVGETSRWAERITEPESARRGGAAKQLVIRHRAAASRRTLRPLQWLELQRCPAFRKTRFTFSSSRDATTSPPSWAVSRSPRHLVSRAPTLTIAARTLVSVQATRQPRNLLRRRLERLDLVDARDGRFPRLGNFRRGRTSEVLVQREPRLCLEQATAHAAARRLAGLVVDEPWLSVDKAWTWITPNRPQR